MNMDTRERIVLYTIVLALAIAVVLFAIWILDCPDCPDCPNCGELDERLATIDDAIGRLETTVTNTQREVDGVAGSISTHNGSVVTAHDEMAGRLGRIEVSLAGLECRVAELCPKPGERDWDDSSKCGAAGGCDFTP